MTTITNKIIMGSAIGLSCLVVVFFAVHKFMRNVDRTYDKIIKSRMPMYCYQTYKHIDSDAIAVSYEKFIDSLRKYDTKMKSGKLVTSFKYPAFFFPKNQEVYVLFYTPDSTIAKIAFYPVQEPSRAHTGYVLANSLHQQKAQ